MKWFSNNNLVSALRLLNNKHLTFSSALQETLDEIYDNLEDLDGRITGCSYSEDDETLTVPAAVGAVADETLTLT